MPMGYHYHQKEWPNRVEFILGKYNVKYVPLVDPRNIYLNLIFVIYGVFRYFFVVTDHFFCSKVVAEKGKLFCMCHNNNFK